MVKPTKQETVELLTKLNDKWSKEELGVAIGRSSMTIWSWSNANNRRVPCKSDFEALKKMLNEQ